MNVAAQERLLSARALVVGVRSWGVHTVRALSGVGIGLIALSDPEMETDALERFDFAPDTKVASEPWHGNSGPAESLLEDADVVVDCLEDWQHKLMISDLCMQMKTPLIHAGGAGSRFQVYTMLPGRSACLRCVFPEVGMDDVPLTSSEHAALLPVHVMIGALQAIESVKIIARIGATQGNELWKYDWLSGEFETVHGLDPRSDCPDCGRYARG